MLARMRSAGCAAAVTLFVCAGGVFGGEVVFDRTVHRGECPVDYVVTVNDTDAPGFFRFTVMVDNTENMNIADITAVYLEFDVDGFDASQWYSDVPGVDFIQQSDAMLRWIEFNTRDVGNGNISGNGDLFDLFDIGIAIGELDGIDGGDDYQMVVFDMAVKAGLTLDDLEAVGVRGQSVGLPDGERLCSSKEFVLSTCPGDFNSDGFLDTRDWMAFMNAWVAHDPSADFNGDGVFNTLDWIAWGNSFEDAWYGRC